MAEIVPLGQLAGVVPDPALWTAVIPAAGRGSRLGSAAPKLLYPLLGRPILDWLLDAVRPSCRRLVFVLAPAQVDVVRPLLERRLGGEVAVVLQESPLGMGDAVRLAAPRVTTPHTLVVWGDQATLRATTVAACAAWHERRPGAALTLPTVLREEPYIHLERDREGRLLRVLQAREGEIHQAVGENDCGLFLFRTALLFSLLEAARVEGGATGAGTREFNLLQVLPRFETGPGAVGTVRIEDVEETQGVNTPQDACLVEGILRRRGVTGHP
ncbi:MAG: NTP transferase domain-containing protein [Magnetococcales bacterium]|nr:NTP transferase domain-containing protein [Magnetococcales bacterium]MBF0155635.1 NTP transferase domain-containing protein [Magnetococcales bacterium]